MKNHISIALAASAAVFSVFVVADSRVMAQSSSPESIVVALRANGMEAAISPIPEKLARLGLKWEAVRDAVIGRRFFEGQWTIKIDEKDVDLAYFTKIATRKLEIAPFVVGLPDGRKMSVIPSVERIGKYQITGQEFVQAVHERVTDLFLDDPMKVNLLGGIRWPPPDVPVIRAYTKLTSHINFSTGEPFDQLAKIIISGSKGPDAMDLRRMRLIRSLVDKAVSAETGSPRADFERHFGVVMETGRSGWIYKIGRGSIQLWYEGTPEVVRSIYFIPPEAVSKNPPRDFGKEARSIAESDRDSFFSFLQAKAKNATPQEMNRLKVLLQETDSVMSWTAEERRQLLET